jgi:A/G-specific adenine glycosylase
MALETGIQMELPLKEKKTRQKHVYLNYFFIKTGKNTFLQKRSSGFWKNLYEFPLIEGNQSEGDLIGQVSEFMDFRGNFELELSWHTRHILSHRILHIDFYTINVQVKPKPLNSSIFEIDLNELEEQYPVPVPIALFIKKI